MTIICSVSELRRDLAVVRGDLQKDVTSELLEE